MKTPLNDPLIAEVRSIRDKHAARFGYDLQAIFRDIKRQQESSGRQYVRYAARPADATITSQSK